MLTDEFNEFDCCVQKEIVFVSIWF